MSSNISESFVSFHRERSFFSRVFGGSRRTDAEAAVENLIAERGLDNVDVVAIDNCLHKYGLRAQAVKALLLQVWGHAVERVVRIDGTLDNLEAAFLDRLKEVLGLGEVEANNQQDSVLTAKFMDLARPLIGRSDAQSEQTRSRITRIARQLRISPDKQKSLLKNLAQASFDSILKYWIGKGRIDAITANALLAFKDEYGLSLAETEKNELERCWYLTLLDKATLPKEDVDVLLNADETCHFPGYSVLLAQTEAFLRYLGQEVDDLAGPIAASHPRLAVRDTATGRQIIHTTFVSVVAYLARMGGPITEPTLAFWKCIENSLAMGCGAAPSSIEKIREFFNRVAEAKTLLALNKLALSDLRLLPALQQYDAEHGTKFAERARMLIWRFATSFVGVDGESTPDEESALAEFRQALDGSTAWTLLDVLPDNLALLKQLKATIDDAKDAIETTFIQAATESGKNVEGDFYLALCLQTVAVHLAWRLGDISDEQVRFYRDFTWVFDKMSCDLPTDNLSWWRRWLEGISRDPIPEFREPCTLSLDFLKSYDSAHATNYADRCRATLFRFANAFVKADGQFSDADREALEKLKALLYPPATAKPDTTAAEHPSSQPVKQETKLECLETQSADTLMHELQTMVGLQRVKAEVAQLVDFLKVQQLRKSKGLPATQISRHLVFMGNPGTGKTTVARLLASIYKALGILSKGHLVETDRSGLVGGYLGQTAIKVQEIVNTALGGVLFIDEAYALVERADDSFGQEAVDTLLKLMEDNRDDLIVVVAGYTEKMTKFLSSNPGMKSRFNKYITFEDYSPDELVEIFEHFCSKARFRLTPAAKEKLEALIRVLHEGRDETFGNGRLARNLFEAAISKQATRIVAEPQVDEQTLSAIEPPDIPDLSEVSQGTSTKSPPCLQSLLQELNALTGLDAVKHEVQSLINYLRIQRSRAEKGLPSEQITTHLVFTGNPGTGKTTVARLLAELYRAIGFLPGGQLIETDRSGLVGKYLGQTAIKTSEVVKKALGGVLFIDEAYALTEQYATGDDAYGQEAINTLVKAMEDNRDRLVVIVAGYTAPMQQFLASNPGLQSRFTRFIEFPDYSPKELLQIFTDLTSRKGYTLAEDALQRASDLLKQAYQNRGETFGNARLVRTMFERATVRLSNRLADDPDMTREELTTLHAEDIEVSREYC